MAKQPTDIPGAIERLTARIESAKCERDDLRRVRRSRDDVIAAADAAVDVVAARCPERLKGKLTSLSAPHAPPLRLFTGPDAELLTFLLRDRMKDAIRRSAPNLPDPPADREPRLAALEAEIASLQAELAAIHSRIEAHRS
ncbi:hypothetical protein [Thiorhodovibrio frisius]|nr:hypothetical protein [Thiorhodovibrio frisius]